MYSTWDDTSCHIFVIVTPPSITALVVLYNTPLQRLAVHVIMSYKGLAVAQASYITAASNEQYEPGGCFTSEAETPDSAGN